jgi:hypothetical protein
MLVRLVALVSHDNSAATPAPVSGLPGGIGISGRCGAGGAVIGGGAVGGRPVGGAGAGSGPGIGPWNGGAMFVIGCAGGK